MKRFALLFVLALIGAGIFASSAAALRFADAPCPEAGGGGVRTCPAGLVEKSYSVQLDGAGGCGPDPNVPGSGLPYEYRLLNGSLPPGLSLSGSGLIGGSPTNAGTYNFWVELSDEDPPSALWCVPAKAEREFTITILPALSLSKDPLAPGTLGTAYTVPIVATLKYAPDQTQPTPSPLAWSVISGALPPGVGLGATDGVLSGTPTTVGSFTFTVQAVLDSERSDTETYTIVVRDPLVIAPPTLKGSRLGRSEVGIPLSGKLSVTGGTGTFTSWTLAGGALPAGVLLGEDGTISGTPTVAGRFTFTASVSDTEGRTATVDTTLNVAAKLGVKTLRLRAGKVGRLYRAKVATLGGVVPTKWKILRGPLPRGIRFDKKLGVFLGTPRREGTYRVTVEVVDALGAKSQKTLAIVVTG